MLEVKEAFQQMTRKQIEVRVIEQRDLEGFFSGFLPPSLVDDFVEMTRMFLLGGFLVNEMNDLLNAKRGDDSLVEALQSLWTTVGAEWHGAIENSDEQSVKTDYKMSTWTFGIISTRRGDYRQRRTAEKPI